MRGLGGGFNGDRWWWTLRGGWIVAQARVSLGLARYFTQLSHRRVSGSDVALWPCPPTRGMLIDAQPSSTAGLGGASIPARTWRVSYSTDDSTGRVIPSTALVVTPMSPWTGNGVRPVVGFAPSTQGMAQHADPSVSTVTALSVYRRGLVLEDVVVAYELPIINYLVARGVTVVVIDYPRDPDTGLQLYANNIACGGALLDALVATSGRFFPAQAPVGLWGFSQGGGAAGSACEQAGTVPLNIRAAVVGAPPSSLLEVLEFLDVRALTSFISLAVLGFYSAHPDAVDLSLQKLSEAGRSRIKRTAVLGAIGAIAASWRARRGWSADTAALREGLAHNEELVEELARHRLGTAPLHQPTLLWGNQSDDVIPYAQVRDIADGWKRLSPEYLHFRSYRLLPLPVRVGVGHFACYVLTLPRHIRWLLSHLV